MTITVLVPNPSLDRTLRLERLRPGDAQRVVASIETAGGKGLNVARVLRSLHTAARLVGPLGGYSGQRVAELARENGLAADWLWLESGQTRTCTLLVEAEPARATALNERGPELSAQQWAALLARRDCHESELLLICGSLPPGADAEPAAALIRQRQLAGRRSWVDTSGAALRTLLAAEPELVKVNAEELAAALGLSGAGLPELDRAAALLTSGGRITLIVTRGSAGALAYRSGRCWAVSAPQVPVSSTIGCGDAFFAGLAAAERAGQAFTERLCWAAAAAAAEAMTPLPGCIDAATAVALRHDVIVTEQ